MSQKYWTIVALIFFLAFVFNVWGLILRYQNIESEAEIHESISDFELKTSLVERKIQPEYQVTYPAEIVRIVEGDTYDIRIHLWENIVKTKRIRLPNIDTPKLAPIKGTPEEREQERIKARQAKEFVEEQLKNKIVYFKSSWKTDNFGRAIGTIIFLTPEGQSDIEDEIIVAGLGNKSITPE